MGFCLYNQVAVAAADALARGLERVAVVDWDLHHGNGTQAIFDADPRVLYVSTHAYPYYPGTGAVGEHGIGEAAGTKINIPLPHGAGDRAFLAAYQQVAVPALEAFEPELVLVSCGWDSHARDPLGALAVSTEGYTAVAKLVLDAAERICDGRLVAVLEGGYDEHALACCAQALCELLLGDEPTPDPEQGAGRPELVARDRCGDRRGACGCRPRLSRGVALLDRPGLLERVDTGAGRAALGQLAARHLAAQLRDAEPDVVAKPEVRAEAAARAARRSAQLLLDAAGGLGAADRARRAHQHLAAAMRAAVDLDGHGRSGG